MEECLVLAEKLYQQMCYEVKDLKAAKITDSEPLFNADRAIKKKRIRDMAHLITFDIRALQTIGTTSLITAYVETYLGDAKQSVRTIEELRLHALLCDLCDYEADNSLNNRPVDSLSEFAAQHVMYKKVHNDSYYRTISAFKCAILNVLPETASRSITDNMVPAALNDNCELQENISSETTSSSINEEAHDSNILFCRKCGFKLLPDSTFCSRCGAKID